MDRRAWVDIILRKVTLYVGDDGRLHATPASALTPELRELLAMHKDRLVEWLSDPWPVPTHCRICNTTRLMIPDPAPSEWLRLACGHGVVTKTDPHTLGRLTAGDLKNTHG